MFIRLWNCCLLSAASLNVFFNIVKTKFKKISKHRTKCKYNHFYDHHASTETKWKWDRESLSLSLSQKKTKTKNLISCISAFSYEKFWNGACCVIARFVWYNGKCIHNCATYVKFGQERYHITLNVTFGNWRILLFWITHMNST